MSDTIVSHWLEKLERVIEDVDVIGKTDQMTPRLWIKYEQATDDIQKLLSFLEHESGYLHGKIAELGEEAPQHIQE
jgi:hypothetical protein